MESLHGAELRRSSSQTSGSSSRKSSTVRVRPRKHSSNTSLQNAQAPSDKSFTSFPSLLPSPGSSPIASRIDSYRSTPQVGANSEPAPPTVRKVSKAVQSLVGSLVSTPPSTKSRTALFDDTPQDIRVVPGNLHHATDEHLERMLDRHGALDLVRQLASDLAERDAQMTVLRRRAEERERVFRKMLQECEVSHLDIETRLREVDKRKKGDKGAAGLSSGETRRRDGAGFDGTVPDDELARRIARAMEDEQIDSPDDLSIQEEVATSSNHADANPETELIQEAVSKTTESSKNWKSYLWSGNTGTKRGSKPPSIASNLSEEVGRTRSRASSGTQAPRKGLSNELFMPPPHDADHTSPGLSSLRRLQSEDRAASVSSSRRSSTSVTSWALRLVAGNSQAKADLVKPIGQRGRAPTAGVEGIRGVRDDSMDSTGTSRSAIKVNEISAKKGRGHRLSLGPTGTIKNVVPEALRGASKLGPTSPLGPPNRQLSNLGPVEMDTILPEDTRPPTLVLNHNMSASQEFLTDRFGFIYDQRRRKRQNEAAAAIQKQKRASNIESLGDGRDAIPDLTDLEQQSTSPDSLSLRPASAHSSNEEPNTITQAKKWQDFLKLATFPTELLSHTPSVAPITTVETVEAESSSKLSQVSVDKRGSIPALSANPEPSPSRVVSGNAELISPSEPGQTNTVTLLHMQPDPVRALLEQLTELHDNLQREKTLRWNEFLRKVRAERKREGEAAAADGRPNNIAMPETLLTDGEIIGIASLGNKGNVGRAKWKEFRQLVLGGIPVAYRAKIWTECSGAAALRIPGYYEDLVNDGDDDPIIVSQIEMDITRTLTDNIFFRKGPGVNKLNEVLLAYSRRNTEVGYCQGMNLIAACLLLIMPTAEDAFWVLASMIENILPQNYYDHSLLTSRADQVVLRQYVAELLPRLSAHLDELGIELEALSFQWFLSVFTDCLSAEALFRVWDVILCMHDGSTFLFQVAMALLKLNERALLDCDSSAGVYHYINHEMTNHAISIDGLIQASEALRKVVRRKEVEERRAVAVDKEKEVIRQREEFRRDRARGAKDKVRSSGNGNERLSRKPAEDGPVEGDARNGAMSSSPLDLSRSSSVAPLSMMSRDSEIEHDSSVEVDHRTPMPIDEEVMWRA